jgi:hypothetical protein
MDAIEAHALTRTISHASSSHSLSISPEVREGVSLSNAHGVTVANDSALYAPVLTPHLEMTVHSIHDNLIVSDSEDDMDIDGGVSLNLHAAALNAEMDLLDQEIMGEENYNIMMQDQQDHEMEHDAMPADDSQPSASTMPMDIAHLHPTAANLPATMTEVSQQLQHLQDGLELADMTGMTAHGSVGDNSIYPLSLDVYPFIPTTSVGENGGGQDGYGILSEKDDLGLSGMPVDTLVDGASQDDPVHVVGPTHLEYLIGLGIYDVSAGEGEMDTEDEEANETVVEDQANLDLYEFMWNWATSMGGPRKRLHGPNLEAVQETRKKKLKSIHRSDLQGEYCDVQGLDWSALDVKRTEARSVRRRTYTNYVNLGQPVLKAVSCSPFHVFKGHRGGPFRVYWVHKYHTSILHQMAGV